MINYLAILFSVASGEVKYLKSQDLGEHPVFGTDLPRISPHGCYKPTSGTADKRLEPFDHGDEEFRQGYELVDVIPASFDIRNVDGINMSSRPLQQHLPVYCGGCWAFGTTSAISDRFKYMRRAAWPDVNLSVQGLLNCGKTAGTCTVGGSDTLVYRYAKEFGFVDDSCLNAVGQSLPCTDITRCMNCDPPNAAEGWVHGKCYPAPKYKTYHVKAYGNLPVTNDDAPGMVEQMKAEIFARGPISCQIAAAPMERYLSGILTDKPEDSGEIDHIVSVSGWGVDPESGVEYWIVRNSWGMTWGETGWFRVEMHKNALYLESGCTFGIPEWPPRDYEVPAERMIFTNGIQTEIPAWLNILDESPWEFDETKQHDEKLIQSVIDAQKKAMKAPSPLGGFAFKVDQKTGMGYTEYDYADVHAAKWAEEKSNEL